MKTSFIVLAVLGVEARENLRVEMGHLLADSIPQKVDFLNIKKSLEPKGPVCEIKPEDKLSMPDLVRHLKYGAYNSFVRGFYDTKETHPISQECLGDWMKEDIHKFWPTIKKLVRGHYFEIGFDEAKAASDALLEMIYKNIDECKWMAIRDDLMELCLENPNECLFMAGLHKKVDSPEQLWPLVQIGFDLWEVINSDDSCYSDMDQIQEFERLILDFAKIMRNFYGFEGHLDLNKPHKSMSAGHFLHKILKIVGHQLMEQIHEFSLEVRSMIPHFSYPRHSFERLGHWGENPTFRCPFSGQPMSLPQLPFFQPQHHHGHHGHHEHKGNGWFGRPDEMPGFHFPNLSDLHLF